MYDDNHKEEFELLSERQQSILVFIEQFIYKEGYPPTIREIGEACDINSTSVVNYNLNKLVQAEWLERTKEKSRGIRLLRSINPPKNVGSTIRAMVRSYEPENVAYVPRVGRIVASEPVLLPGDDFGQYYDPDMDMIEVSRNMLRGLDVSEVFALEVKGDSMVDALIADGDIVILRKQQTCKDGDMVAVWLPDDSTTTLKEFHDEGGRIRLQPRNPTMEPIYVHPNNCQIQGKVLGVVRMM
ncbi:MAG: repressor LexA [Anaerolineae bacterium]|nr:repressor LexA [Anaerolineae bacterium]